MQERAETSVNIGDDSLIRRPKPRIPNKIGGLTDSCSEPFVFRSSHPLSTLDVTEIRGLIVLLEWPLEISED